MRIAIYVLWLILAILLSIIVMFLIQRIEKAIYAKSIAEGQPSSSVLDSPITCILVDILIYVISGMFVNVKEYPVWAICLYAIAYEIITQCYLGYFMPQFFHSTWLKSTIDLGLITLFYWLGTWLQTRAIRKGKQCEKDDNKCTKRCVNKCVNKCQLALCD